MIGDRIKQRRVALGLSLEELAERTGNYVSRQVIHKYEQGNSMPGSDVLLRLADALGVKVEFFFREQEHAVELSEPAYRKRGGASAKGLQALKAKTQELLERYLFVESLYPPKRFRRFIMPTVSERRVRKIEDAEESSLALRKRWNLGIDPIENVLEVFEDRGVKVILLDGEDDFDGLSCWANDKIPVVVVKKGLTGDRERFNLAHELGHLLLRVPKNIDPEKAAHRFAASFLVPAEAACRELGEHRRRIELLELAMLKKKYGLSMQAWVYRAQDLGIITNSCAAILFKTFRSRGWTSQEPGDLIPPEEPRQFERLILQAVSEDLISSARAAELLGRPLNDFRKQMGADLVGGKAAASS
jgi:Zn-dependent peptidase ImmA (M78 family)/transcriptional regulator with XRE-family HTH domain